MRIAPLALMAALATLVACRATAPVSNPPDAPTGMADTQASTDRTAQARRPALSMDVLPSMTRTGTLKASTAVRQRPIDASATLQTLSQGETVQILGELSNAEGRWLSIAYRDVQGWVRMDEVMEP
ncbi:MAG: hypothetical protein Q7J29_03295 [Stagnimonas sp.]|nr:hypothetical protein [Stagnimonas sp.]